jgi:hypothetical protein
MNTSLHYTGYRFDFSANQSMYNFNMLTNIKDYKLDVKPRMVSLFPFLPSVSWSFKF